MFSGLAYIRNLIEPSNSVITSNMPPGSYHINSESSYQQRNTLPPGWTSAFVCACGRYYQRVSSLRLHYRLECGKEPSVSCNFCDKKFHHKGSMKRHVFSIHKSESVSLINCIK